MSAHTPGPWFYDNGQNGKYFPHVVLGGNDPKSREYITVNTCAGQNGGSTAECNANARLIAAAPDLLAALEALEAACAARNATSHYRSLAEEHEAREAARAAIAKAKGVTP